MLHLVSGVESGGLKTSDMMIIEFEEILHGSRLYQYALEVGDQLESLSEACPILEQWRGALIHHPGPFNIAQAQRRVSLQLLSEILR